MRAAKEPRDMEFFFLGLWTENRPQAAKDVQTVPGPKIADHVLHQWLADLIMLVFI